MRDLKIGLCYHPTTIVFVDDSQDYLMNLQGWFNEVFPCLAFDDPVAAHQYINETYREEPFIRRCTTIREDGRDDHLESDVNIKVIQQEIYRPKRFSEIAVVVVDYAMPDLNGIEFCQQIKNPNILIILLTGEADHNIAVKAFNEGIIDIFLEKGTKDIGDILYKEILKLQQQYFIKLSEIIINQANPNNLRCLEDRDVAQLFHRLCEEHNISEYYILSEKGDFLLLNVEGQPSWLTIKSEEEMQSLFEYAELSEAPSTVLSALKHREKLPLFYAAQDPDPSPDEWENYLSSAQPVSNAPHYYYAYITNAVDDSNTLGEIISYDAYLANV